MSRLIPLAVALLLLTAGCTSAGPQSPSSNNVTTEVSTASPVDVQTDAATGTQSADSSGDASNAAAEGETEMDGADGGQAGSATTTATPETDASSSADSDASSGSQADDDSNANSRSNAGGSNDESDDDDSNDDGDSESNDDESNDGADDDDSSANAGESNDSDDGNPAPSSDSSTNSTATEANSDSTASNETTESATATETPSPSADDANQTEWTVGVVEVVEADTLTVEFSDGSVDEVRLVGVEAPDGDYADDDFEGMPTEDGGEEWLDDYVSVANDFTRERVAGENVTIRVDSAADRRDAQGRLLVYLDAGGETLNEQLVRQGHAQVSEHSFSKRASYEQAETNARQGYSGLWQFFEPDPLATETETSNQNSWTVTVEDVLAGDRVEVSFADGQTEVVQLLGVDTPDGDYADDDFEGIPTEDGGEEWLDDWEGEAESYTSDAVGGDEVTISVGSQAPRRDADGTLLVYLESDGGVLNERLIQQGYAQLSDRSFAERGDYADAELNAQQGYSGLWEFLWEDPLATETDTETDGPAASPDDEAASTEEATEPTTETTQSESTTETTEASRSDSTETTDTETETEPTDTESESTDTATETADTESEPADSERSTTDDGEAEDTDEAAATGGGESDTNANDADDEEETADSGETDTDEEAETEETDA